MSTTPRMGIQLINSSDFVDPSVINDGFKKLDVLGIDYVVDSGTSGEWWYRKWKSGRAECGIDSHTFPTSGPLQWGNVGWWLTDFYAFPAFPFAFASIPHTSIMFISEDGGALGGIIHIRATHDNSTYRTNPPRFSIADPLKRAYTNPKCSIFTTGRYK